MRIAEKSDKKKVVSILLEAFLEIKILNSINFITRIDKNRPKRLKVLMEYQFDRAILEGKIMISDNDDGVILFLENSSLFSFKKLVMNIKLLFGCIGIKNVFNVLKREKLLVENHPKEKFIHLWLMAVLPENQGMGVGTKLIQQAMNFYKNELIYLETTTEENVIFYKKNSFKVFRKTEQLDYPLYFLKNV